MYYLEVRCDMSAQTLTVSDLKHYFLFEKDDTVYDELLKASTYKFLARNHIAIQKEHKILEAALDTLNNDETYVKYRELAHYYDELLTLYHQKRNAAKRRQENWVSYLHDNLGTMHLYRIMITFARLTDEQLLSLLHQAKCFQSLNQSLVAFFNYDQSISVLNMPIETLYALSVIVLGLRFLMVSA